MATVGMTTEEPWTVRRILDWTVKFLTERGSDTPRLDAEILLAHARGCRRIQLYTQFDQPLTDDERSTMRELVKRRAASEPVAYLVGHREFFSLSFLVRPGVFIPRPDTEILVTEALDLLKGMDSPNALDLCAGSGCVPIAIAKNHPTVNLTAVELDAEVLEVTQSNIDRHELQGRVRVLQGDLFAPLDPELKFDLITSNPPYVQDGEIEELAADIRDHEPHLALAGGEDGLDVVRRLVRESPDWLRPGGWLLIEISPEQAKATVEIFQASGFEKSAIKHDLAGQARVVVGQWPK